MRLFNRIRKTLDVAIRCPGCRERLPDGADACAMCGYELADDAADRAGHVTRPEASRNPS